MRNQVSNPERVRYLYESLNNLNRTLNNLIPVAHDIAITLTKDEKEKYYGEIKEVLHSLIVELKAVNIKLGQLQTNTGLVRLALNGGADEILSNLCNSIDRLTQTLEQIYKRGGDGNGEKN